MAPYPPLAYSREKKAGEIWILSPRGDWRRCLPPLFNRLQLSHWNRTSSPASSTEPRRQSPVLTRPQTPDGINLFQRRRLLRWRQICEPAIQEKTQNHPSERAEEERSVGKGKDTDVRSEIFCSDMWGTRVMWWPQSLLFGKVHLKVRTAVSCWPLQISLLDTTTFCLSDTSFNKGTRFNVNFECVKYSGGDL